MGNLPSSRIEPARPFLHFGIEFFGPLLVHYKIRGKQPTKVYLAVFCCFATKVVHLEVVGDLSTVAFIRALKRFLGKIGHCKSLHCDNATNFVGANNKFNELLSSLHAAESQESIITTCANVGIQFNFIPSRAPHIGELWKAAVKSAKHLLMKSVATASLTYEKLETVVIEAILNSRPLTPLSSNANDYIALTPGHFLIGEPLTSRVDVTSNQLQAGLLTRWKLVSHLKNQFWNRWSQEYLTELQQRNKW
ncbi:uncharacterized protein LOC119665469 [Teleopsis dalmanni]|uniref:uncharacterized protein LOC119665469 n=1 Tax=Teleopsis dalmanni TaxID=139649 RepID=UPI0018CDA092|nr:uncharacterized protein LOC119665469 [Teleopsis dalmanni]